MNPRTKIVNFAVDPETPESKIRELLEQIEKKEEEQKQNFSGFLSERAACSYLSVSRSTLFCYRKRGLKSYKVGSGKGSRRLFSCDDLDNFVKSGGKNEPK